MIQSPAISVQIPGPLRRECGSAGTLEVSALNVRAVLDELENRHPKLHRCVCDETGAVRKHINLFVNSDNTRDGAGLETTLKQGDVVTIMTAVSGG